MGVNRVEVVESLEAETGEMGEMGEMDSPPGHTPLPALLAIDPDLDPDPVLPHPADLLQTPTLADTPTDSPTATGTATESGVTGVVTQGEENHLEIELETRDGVPAAAARPSIREKEMLVVLPHHAVLPHRAVLPHHLPPKFESEAEAGVGLSHVPFPVRVLPLGPSRRLFVTAAATDGNTDKTLTVVGA